MINTRKEALELLSKKPQGSVSNLEQINPELIRQFEVIDYLRIGETNYQFTKEGMKTYKEVYSPVTLVGGLVGFFFQEILRVKPL